MIAMAKLLFAKYKIAIAAICLGFCFLSGAFVAHKLDSMYWTAHEANALSANLVLWQKAFANRQKEEQKLQKYEANNSAQQNSLDAHAAAVIQEVPNHVKVVTTRQPCISYGFIRVLDAEVNGVLPEQLNLPDGKSDDDCSPLSAVAVASGIISNFKIAKQNEQQLNELIGALHDLENENSEK